MSCCTERPKPEQVVVPRLKVIVYHHSGGSDNQQQMHMKFEARDPTTGQQLPVSMTQLDERVEMLSCPSPLRNSAYTQQFDSHRVSRQTTPPQRGEPSGRKQFSSPPAAPNIFNPTPTAVNRAEQETPALEKVREFDAQEVYQQQTFDVTPTKDTTPTTLVKEFQSGGESYSDPGLITEADNTMQEYQNVKLEVSEAFRDERSNSSSPIRRKPIILCNSRMMVSQQSKHSNSLHDAESKEIKPYLTHRA